jgi:hypothetical protein
LHFLSCALHFANSLRSELSFGAAMTVVGTIENASIATIAIRQCVM